MAKDTFYLQGNLTNAQKRQKTKKFLERKNDSEMTQRKKLILLLDLILELAVDTGVTPPVIPEDTPVDYGNILFVTPGGNDDTAEKGILTKPYQTIQAAEADAVSGDLIEVFPGNYTTSNLGKTGVNYNLQKGAVLSSAFTNGVPTGVSPVFSDHSGAIVCEITGGGTLHSGGNWALDTDAVNLRTAGTSVRINGANITSASTYGGGAKLYLDYCTVSLGVVAYRGSNAGITRGGELYCTNCRFENAYRVGYPFGFAGDGTVVSIKDSIIYKDALNTTIGGDDGTLVSFTSTGAYTNNEPSFFEFINNKVIDLLGDTSPIELNLAASNASGYIKATLTNNLIYTTFTSSIDNLAAVGTDGRFFFDGNKSNVAETGTAITNELADSVVEVDANFELRY